MRYSAAFLGQSKLSASNEHANKAVLVGKPSRFQATNFTRGSRICSFGRPTAITSLCSGPLASTLLKEVRCLFSIIPVGLLAMKSIARVEVAAVLVVAANSVQQCWLWSDSSPYFFRYCGDHFHFVLLHGDGTKAVWPRTTALLQVAVQHFRLCGMSLNVVLEPSTLPVTYRPLSVHIPSTFDPIPTTFWSHPDHFPNTYRSLTDQPQVTSRALSDRVPTWSRP